MQHSDSMVSVVAHVEVGTAPTVAAGAATRLCHCAHSPREDRMCAHCGHATPISRLELGVVPWDSLGHCTCLECGSLRRSRRGAGAQIPSDLFGGFATPPTQIGWVQHQTNFKHVFEDLPVRIRPRRAV